MKRKWFRYVGFMVLFSLVFLIVVPLSGRAEKENYDTLSEQPSVFDWERQNTYKPFDSYEVKRTNVLEGETQLSAPVIGRNGRVYVAGKSGKIYAYTAEGSSLWIYDTEASIEGSLIIGPDETIYAANSSGKLFAISSTGQLKWAASIGSSAFQSTPAFANGKIYIGNNAPSSCNADLCTAAFFIINASSGTVEKTLETKSSYVWGNAYIYNGRFYFAEQNSMATSYSLSGDTPSMGRYISGKFYPQYHDHINFTQGITYHKGVNLVLTTGMNAFSYINPTVYKQGLFALNPTDGKQAWVFGEGGSLFNTVPAISSEGTIYIGADNGVLYGLNILGQEQFRFQGTGKMAGAPLIDTQGNVHIGTMDGYFYSLDRQLNTRWSIKLGLSIQTAPAMAANGTIYVTAGNTLYTLGGEHRVAATMSAFQSDASEAYMLQPGETSTTLVSDFSLTTSHSAGTAISWQSSNEQYITNTGKVNRPSFAEGDKRVTLTGTVSYGNAQDKYTVEFIVLKEEETDAEKGTRLIETVSISYSSGETSAAVTKPVGLSATTAAESVPISWSSSKPSVISVNGDVTRPSYTEGNQTVTLTASLKIGSAVQTKSFDVTVLRLPETDEEKAMRLIETVSISYSSGETSVAVTKPVGLSATTAAESVPILWSSSKPSIISVNGDVTRPSYTEGNQTVTLKASLKIGDAVQTKSFDVTVLRLPETDAEKANRLASLLKESLLGIQNGDTSSSLTQPLTLASSVEGVPIEWASSDVNYVATDGKVNRPAFSSLPNDPAVDVTASIQVGTEKRSAVFHLKVLRLSETDQEALIRLKKELTDSSLGLADGDTKDAVAKDLTLMKFVSPNEPIIWTSSNEAIIRSSGEVIRPSYTEGDAVVELTAEIVRGILKEKIVFSLTVLKLPETNAEKADQLIASLNEESIGLSSGETVDSVTSSLQWKTKSEGDIPITWSSSAENIIDTQGTVTRPKFAAGDQSVTLTAVIQIEEVRREKKFQLTVKALPASSNADLKVLNVKNQSLYPSFSPAVSDYRLVVSSSASTIQLLLETAENEAEIKVNGSSLSPQGNYQLSYGKNVFTITVKAEDGSEKTYTLTVQRSYPYTPPAPFVPSVTLPGNLQGIIENGTLTLTRIDSKTGQQRPVPVIDTETIDGVLIIKAGEGNVSVPSGQVAILAGITNVVVIEQDEPYKYFPTKAEVKADHEWNVSFNHELDLDSLVEENISIQNMEGEKIPVQISLSQNRRSLHIKPETPYKTGQLYYVTIGRNIIEGTGKKLKEPIRKIFIVE